MAEQQQLGEQLTHQLNEAQRHVAGIVVNVVQPQSQQQSFDIDGAGGTGKPFLFNTFVRIFRGINGFPKLCVCVAYSGIASMLLFKDGTTSHSWFKIPIPLKQNSTCNIAHGTKYAQTLLQASVFI